MTPQHELNWAKIFAWARNILILSGTGLLIHFADTGPDGNLLRSMWTDLWTATKTASPLAAMLLLLLLIDAVKERRKAQEQCQDRTISFVEATNKSVKAMEELSGVIKEILRRRETGERERIKRRR